MVHPRLAAAATAIKQRNSSSKAIIANTFNFWLPKNMRRLALLIGILSTPIAALGLYEKMSPLPEPLNMNFPLLARYYIRRALWSGEEIEKRAYYLDQAMRRVLSAGLGAASPQSTSLVIYLSKLYYEAPKPDIQSLMASHAALTHKPHVGEGVAEERARLEMSFHVALKLCNLLLESDPEGAKEFSKRALLTMEKAPTYLAKSWIDHPLRAKFLSILER